MKKILLSILSVITLNVIFGQTTLQTVTNSGGNITTNDIVVGNYTSGSTSTGVYIGKGTNAQASHPYVNLCVGNSMPSLSTSTNSASSKNCLFGYTALIGNTTGLGNSAFGYDALQRNTTGSYNCSYGWGALGRITSATNNCAFGVSALINDTLSGSNCAFGNNSLESYHGASNQSGNVAIGNFSLSNQQKGSNNVGIGGGSGTTFTSVYDVNGSHQLSIQNTIYGVAMSQASSKIGIGINLPTQKLHVKCLSSVSDQGIRFEDLPSGTGTALVIDAVGNVYKQAAQRQANNSQNLEKELEILKAELAEIKAKLNGDIKSTSVTLTENKLFQNTPNPFNSVTKIEYIVTSEGNNYITIANLEGKQIKMVKLNNSGKGILELNAGSLKTGTYTYSLYANGVLVDTKLMVINK